MTSQNTEPVRTGNARDKLLAAAFDLIREKGYAATSVDELCARAGVTKGAFFHHFKSKEALAVVALNSWTEMSDVFFSAQDFRRLPDPLDRVLGYLDFRKAVLSEDVAGFTCLAGTMLQEAYRSHPDIQVAAATSIESQAATIEADLAEAMELYGVRVSWTAHSLALHTQAVLQGAFILAKAQNSPQVVRASLEHLRLYIELLFRGAELAPTAITGSASAARSRRTKN